MRSKIDTSANLSIWICFWHFDKISSYDLSGRDLAPWLLIHELFWQTFFSLAYHAKTNKIQSSWTTSACWQQPKKAILQNFLKNNRNLSQSCHRARPYDQAAAFGLSDLPSWSHNLPDNWQKLFRAYRFVFFGLTRGASPVKKQRDFLIGSGLWPANGLPGFKKGVLRTFKLKKGGS